MATLAAADATLPDGLGNVGFYCHSQSGVTFAAEKDGGRWEDGAYQLTVRDTLRGVGSGGVEQTENLLVNPSFETGEFHTGYLEEMGVWMYDYSAFVEETLGISPLHETRMVQFLGTTLTETIGSTGRTCTPVQFVDISSYGSLIDAGLVTADFSAYVNRVVGDTNTDTQFNVRLYAASRLPDSSADIWENTSGYRLGTSNQYLTSDSDISTWEQSDTSLPLPSGTRFLVATIHAHENILENNDGTPEFDGHFADDASLVLEFAPGWPLDGDGGRIRRGEFRFDV